MRELTRRKAILGAMSAGAVALAGCLVEDDDGEDGTADDDSQANNDNNGDDTAPEVLDSSLVHEYSDCASGDVEATVVHDGASYLVDGVGMGGNPCHEPVLSEIAVEGSELSVAVDIVHQERGEEQECVDCVGAIGYQALAELDEADSIDRVLVSHGGEELTVEEFSTDPHVYETSIATVEADCGNPDVDEADATLEDGTLVVNGRLSADNPCHDARLNDVSVVGGELNVEISLVAYENDSDDDIGGCASCLGEIAYEASVELLNEDHVEEIVVNHANGENHQF